MKKENELTAAAKLIAESVATFASCMAMNTANSQRRADRVDEDYSEFDFEAERDKLLSKIAELEEAILTIDKVSDNTQGVIQSLWGFYYNDDLNNPWFKVKAKSRSEAYAIAEDYCGV